MFQLTYTWPVTTTYCPNIHTNDLIGLYIINDIPDNTTDSTTISIQQPKPKRVFTILELFGTATVWYCKVNFIDIQIVVPPQLAFLTVYTMFLHLNHFALYPWHLIINSVVFPHLREVSVTFLKLGWQV